MAQITRGLGMPVVWMAHLLALAVGITPVSAQPRGARDAQLIQRLANFESIQTREDVCRTILEGKPNAYARHFCEGYQAILLGLDVEAELALNRTLDARGDFSLAPMIYGDAYRDLGKPDLAEKFYRRAIEIHPERTEARFALGHLLFMRGRDEDPAFLTAALEAFRMMTDRDPQSPDGWSNMALVLTHMERYEDAESVLQKALGRDPSDPFLLDNLGALYARQERDDEAEEAWRKALAINPGYGPAVVDLPASYARHGRLLLALETLEAGRQAVQAPPWGPRIRRNLGFAYMRMEEWERCEEAVSQAAGPGTDPLALLGSGHLKMLKGFTENALIDFERGASLDSTLALPFVRAWKATLKFALSPGQHPGLRRVIDTIEAQESSRAEVSLDPRDQAIRDGDSGVRATRHLADFVLADWKFEEVDAVRDALRSGTGTSPAVEYDTPPQPVKLIEAEYPMAAQDAGQGGTVDIQVVVDEEGNVIQTKIQNCNAPHSLCVAAEAAAGKWVFTPATRYGRPVRASIVIPFRFTPPS